MNLYTQQNTRYLTPLTIIDISTSESTIRYVSPYVLCQCNTYWIRLFFPDDHGFTLPDTFVFETHYPVSTVIKFIDLLHDVKIRIQHLRRISKINTNIEEDIAILFLLHEYGTKDLYNDWLVTKKFRNTNNIEEPDVDNFESWSKEHIDPIRWIELGIEREEQESEYDRFMLVAVYDKLKSSKLYVINKNTLSDIQSRVLDKFINLESIGIIHSCMTRDDPTISCQKRYTNFDEFLLLMGYNLLVTLRDKITDSEELVYIKSIVDKKDPVASIHNLFE